jgi:PilZ domain
VNNLPQDRRRTLRFPFEAPAEVSEEAATSRMPARVTEISLNGCFLQVGTPFPQGASIFVRIFVEGSFFEAHATVVYSQPNLGMGIAFRDLKPAFSAVLKKWLLTAMLAKQKVQS